MSKIIRKPLEKMPYAQATVIIEGDNLYKLQSYETIVVILDKETGWIECLGTYSQTTRKHIGAFAKEIGYHLTYQLLRDLANEKLMYNIYTGEVIPQ